MILSAKNQFLQWSLNVEKTNKWYKREKWSVIASNGWTLKLNLFHSNEFFDRKSFQRRGKELRSIKKTRFSSKVKNGGNKKWLTHSSFILERLLEGEERTLWMCLLKNYFHILFLRVIIVLCFLNKNFSWCNKTPKKFSTRVKWR